MSYCIVVGLVAVTELPAEEGMPLLDLSITNTLWKFDRDIVGRF